MQTTAKKPAEIRRPFCYSPCLLMLSVKRLISRKNDQTCAGYIGAACANIIFAELITWQGWPAAIIMWTVIFIAGAAITIIPAKNATGHT